MIAAGISAAIIAIVAGPRNAVEHHIHQRIERLKIGNKLLHYSQLAVPPPFDPR